MPLRLKAFVPLIFGIIWICTSLNSISVLRRRPTGKVPCDEYLYDDDGRFRKEVIEKVGCFPIYWESLITEEYLGKLCNTSWQMTEIFAAIKNIGQTMERYVQPCNYMEVSLGASQQDRYLDGGQEILLLQVLYMKKHYQEVVNLREFGFNSCWSSIAGFVGIFLGYSFLNFPGALGNFLIWCQKKTFTRH